MESEIAAAIAKTAAGLAPTEYCFLWVQWWPFCMTKSEWSGWVQAIGSILAILATGVAVFKAHELELARRLREEQEGEIARRIRFTILIERQYKVCQKLASQPGGKLAPAEYRVMAAEGRAIEELYRLLDPRSLDTVLAFRTYIVGNGLAKLILSVIAEVSSLDYTNHVIDPHYLTSTALRAQETLFSYLNQMKKELGTHWTAHIARHGDGFQQVN